MDVLKTESVNSWKGTYCDGEPDGFNPSFIIRKILHLCDTQEVSFKAKFALEPYGRYHVLMLHYFLPLQRISLSLRLLGNAEQGCRVQ